MEVVVKGGIREGRTTIAALIVDLLGQHFKVSFEDDISVVGLKDILDNQDTRIEALKNNNLCITVKTELEPRKR